MLLERFFDGDGSDTQTANATNGPVGAFRDVGIQIFETYKVGSWEHSYAGMVGNGNGITRGNNDNNYDTYAYWSSEKIFGGKGPRIESWKMFAWGQQGKRTLTQAGAGTYDRTRAGFGTTFRKGKHRAAFEYIYADGMIFNGTDGGAVAGSRNNANSVTASFNVATEGKADGYYIHYGFAPVSFLEFDIRYDLYNRLNDAGNEANERQFQTVTVGAQYFFNKKTRMVLNYEAREASAPNLSGTAPPNKILDSIDNRFSAQVLAIF